jgi:type II secretory pathway component PulF
MSLVFTPRHFAQRAEFYHQLAQLTAAGIGVLPALEQLQRNPPGGSFREPIQTLLLGLNEGLTLSGSMHQLDGWLPEFDIALLDAGERSGRLDACFRLLADHYNDQARITKQLIGQLLYPVGVIHLAAVVFLIVLPFARSQFHASLIMLVAKAALVLAPLYLATAGIVYATQSQHGQKWRALVESFLRRIPVLGTARRCLALARLAAALEALINAGVNIIQAWELAGNASGSPALQRVVASMKPEMDAGRTPAELLRERAVFPVPFANLYASGEISGKLDETLRRLHAHYQEEGSHKLQAFAQWLPRLIYGLVAALVAYNVIQFWTGYFNQISTITNGF